MSAGCLDLSVGCLDLSFGCLDFSFGCLDLSFGCLDLSFGCLDLSNMPGHTLCAAAVDQILREWYFHRNPYIKIKKYAFPEIFLVPREAALAADLITA